jgi:hypothetical protein
MSEIYGLLTIALPNGLSASYDWRIIVQIENQGTTTLNTYQHHYDFAANRWVEAYDAIFAEPYVPGTVYGSPLQIAELKFNGANVLVGSLGAWQAIGAEKLTSAPGFEFAWRYGFSDQYDIWYTDLSGNYLGETGPISGSSYQLQSLEPTFHQDLNSDAPRRMEVSSSTVLQATT